MEFVIKQNALKEELGFVQGIVEKKSTIPVLSKILIESVGENYDPDRRDGFGM